MLYRRGVTWWYKFRFAGRLFQESAKTDSKTIARAAELKRKRELQEGYHGLKKRQAPVIFTVAAEDYLKLKQPTLAAKSYVIETTNLKHLRPQLGQLLVTDIDAHDIARYQQHRLAKGAAPKTVNLEIGTLRAILRRHRVWGDLQPDVRMLPTTDDIGIALAADQETRLLEACDVSRSRSLPVAVRLALNTGMRAGEIRLLRWKQIDLEHKRLTVGKSKTDSGTGRVIPLNDRACKVLEDWADAFPNRKPQHHVFPTEQYGIAGHDRQVRAFHTNPSEALNGWKVAWESAKASAGVECRFHDLRHTACTRLLERAVPLSVVASILGWSAATTIRMAKRYGHIGAQAQRDAVALL
jgi:integrase